MFGGIQLIMNIPPSLHMQAEGEYECIFVTDSEEDPAVPLLHSLIAAQKKATGRAARILFSGQAQKTSQKIHKCVLVLAGVQGMGLDLCEGPTPSPHSS